ncbi:MAG: hypothetical protein WAM30_19620 [Candidatus Dormiibacterota bacterium]
MVWTHALQDLEEAASRSPASARRIYETAERMAALGWSLGHPTGPGIRYWAVPPFGVFYRVRGDRLYVLEIIDVRTLRQPLR